MKEWKSSLKWKNEKMKEWGRELNGDTQSMKIRNEELVSFFTLLTKKYFKSKQIKQIYFERFLKDLFYLASPS